MPKKASTTQLVHIRMPKAFHGKLMREADRKGQTLNAEILMRLQQSFEAEPALRAVGESIQKSLASIQEANRTLREATSPEKDLERVTQWLSKHWGRLPDEVLRVIKDEASKREKRATEAGGFANQLGYEGKTNHD